MYKNWFPHHLFTQELLNAWMYSFAMMHFMSSRTSIPNPFCTCKKLKGGIFNMWAVGILAKSSLSAHLLLISRSPGLEPNSFHKRHLCFPHGLEISQQLLMNFQ